MKREKNIEKRLWITFAIIIGLLLVSMASFGQSLNPAYQSVTYSELSGLPATKAGRLFNYRDSIWFDTGLTFINLMRAGSGTGDLLWSDTTTYLATKYDLTQVGGLVHLHDTNDVEGLDEFVTSRVIKDSVANTYEALDSMITPKILIGDKGFISSELNSIEVNSNIDFVVRSITDYDIFSRGASWNFTNDFNITTTRRYLFKSSFGNSATFGLNDNEGNVLLKVYSDANYTDLSSMFSLGNTAIGGVSYWRNIYNSKNNEFNFSGGFWNFSSTDKGVYLRISGDSLRSDVEIKAPTIYVEDSIFVGDGWFKASDILSGGGQIDTIFATTLQVDDIASDDFTLDSNGIRLYGRATQWTDVAITGFNITTSLNSPIFTTGWAGSSAIGAWYYEGSVIDDIAYFNMQIPHGIVDNDTLSIHIHWGATTTPVAGDTAVFLLTYSFANINSTFPSVSTQTIKIPLNGTAQWGHNITNLILSPTGTGTLSRIWNCSLQRLANSNASDTYTGNIGLLSIDAHARIESFGSNNMTSE